MFDIRDLFQWERFITPSIIKVFYWLAVVMALLAGLQSVLGGLSALFSSPIVGFVAIIGGVLVALVGVIFARIGAEFILIVFRINEHLGAIRSQGEQHQ
jgi:uncharacterized sodium:solute symporter family permease YidK